MLKVNPYIVLDGKAKEAMSFYAEALSGQVVATQTFGEMPSDPNYPLPEEAKDRISHGLLMVGDTPFMFSDTFPGMPVTIGDNVNICLTTDDPAKTRRIYEALKEGGKVGMELQETFWSPAYGNVTDKYGVTFQLSTETAGER